MEEKMYYNDDINYEEYFNILGIAPNNQQEI